MEFWTVYVAWVKAHPLGSAAAQFAVLGTLGEHLPILFRQRRWTSRYRPAQFVAVFLAWALLGIIIKFGFVAMRGATTALVEHGMLPVGCEAGLGKALAVSVITNLFFGPQMMIWHRLTDNWILRRWSFEGLHRALWTLLWFWIPAHTLTFSLPPEYQVGLAACWSVVLGGILGLSTPSATSANS